MSETEIERLTRELAEADRRAGEAERYLERLKVEQSKERNWIWEAKAARGYDQNVSFDRVWAETCAKADRIATLTAERDAALDRALDCEVSIAYVAENKQLRAELAQCRKAAEVTEISHDGLLDENEKLREALDKRISELSDQPFDIFCVSVTWADVSKLIAKELRAIRALLPALSPPPLSPEK